MEDKLSQIKEELINRLYDKLVIQKEPISPTAISELLVAMVKNDYTKAMKEHEHKESLEIKSGEQL